MDFETIVYLGIGILIAIFVKRYFENNQSTISTKPKTFVSEKKEEQAKKGVQLFTKEEVAKHNKREDCWLIIKDKVYDVTPFIDQHLGGDAILNNAGADSTQGFFGDQHSKTVGDMLWEYHVGDLKKE